MRITILAITLIISGINIGYAAEPSQPSESQESRCLKEVVHMLEIIKNDASNTTTNEELNSKRKQLVDKWQGQLQKGTSPCSVYSEITKQPELFDDNTSKE
jgi:hypothetical protein